MINKDIKNCIEVLDAYLGGFSINDISDTDRKIQQNIIKRIIVNLEDDLKR